MSFLRITLAWIASNKLLFFLSITTFVFFVCTVSLGTQNSYLNDEVNYCRSINITTPATTTTTTRQVLPSSELTTMETTAPPNPDLEGWRLPENLYNPISYDLTLKPDLTTGDFSGTIKILFDINKSSDQIQLNSNGLNITSATLIPSDTNSRIICKGSVDKEILTLVCLRSNGQPPMEPGIKCELVIEFSGDMKNRIVGLYRSSYLNETGETRATATFYTHQNHTFLSHNRSTHSTLVLTPNLQNTGHWTHVEPFTRDLVVASRQEDTAGVTSTQLLDNLGLGSGVKSVPKHNLKCFKIVTMTTRTQTSGGRTVYTILLSVCLFLGVICACLLVALVLIGRNLAGQSFWSRNCELNTTVENVTTGYINDAETFDNDTSKEISVKINLSTGTETYLSSTPQPDWRSGWRLPIDVRPLHYDLTFRPMLTDGTFSGKTNITFQSTEPRDHFVLHGDRLNISLVEMFSAETHEKIEVINFHNDSVHQLWVVDLEDTLAPGVYSLIFEYFGSMRDKRVGLYSSTYLDENDTRRYIATSKLEPTYARQAFPCFDEPNYKANYTVHLQIPKEDGYIALSNMDQNGEPEPIEGDDEHQMVNFNPSVPMSTYVSCFIVCDFTYLNDTINSISEKQIPLRVYATPAQVKNTAFALDTAKKVTENYEKYFGLAYPLPKLDMIAVPDFVSGAMEHWGLVTYRETALLYNELTSNAANKQRVATVVAHELAHMWFGNLVTLDWWNDLWLNEGFATYMEYKAINGIIPEWGMLDQFLIDELHPVLDFDSTLATHPIVVTVTTPNQITEIFDSISYNKGASVLRMLENAIGDENFQKGIQKYLKAHAYKNAVTKDLWKELQTTVSDSNLNIEEIMDTWTVLPGYPIITMSKESDNTYKLLQKRFLADPTNIDILPPNSYKWTIPVTYFTDQEPETVNVTWFNKDESFVTIKVPENTAWFKLNHHQVGYYRVNYTPDMWKALTKHFKELNATDRTNLLEDSFSIAKTGELPYNIPLDMTQEMKEEKNYVAWTVALKKFNELKTLLKSDSMVYSKFQKYVLIVLDAIYGDLGWDAQYKDNEEQEHQNKLLRAKILNAACSYGNEECKANAKKNFDLWLKTGTIDLDTKALVYEHGMEHVSKEDWEKVFDIYMDEKDAAEKLKLLNGLASVKDQELLKLLLERAKNETVVRSQDYFTCLQYISYNEDGTEIVWHYVREHWDELVERFTLNDRYLGRLIPVITSSFVTETKLSEMETFFAKYPDAGAGEISRKQALENVKNNIKWIKEHFKEVSDWLDLNNKNVSKNK